MKVETTRFGELTVEKKDILEFKEGILGFDQLTKFFVVDPGDSTLILWLQSIENPQLAFPILEPKIYMPDYIVKLLPAELMSLQLDNVQNASIYTILTIPEDVTKMTANMKAPIVINNTNNLARQIVLQDNKLNVQFEMYKALKQYIVNFNSDDSRRTRVELIETEEETSETAPTSNSSTAELPGQ